MLIVDHKNADQQPTKLNPNCWDNSAYGLHRTATYT